MSRPLTDKLHTSDSRLRTQDSGLQTYKEAIRLRNDRSIGEWAILER